LASTRAFGASRLGATLQALYACSPGRCPAFRGQGLAFTFVELTYRLFRCGQCSALLLIDRKCDSGHRYCSDTCRKEARREKHAQAQADYQRDHHEKWKIAHRNDQKNYRDRERAREEQLKRAASGVTDQGLVHPATKINIAVSAPTATEDPGERPTEARFQHLPMCCMFCGRLLAPFAGSSIQRWSG
jgi:hypothetical protein